MKIVLNITQEDINKIRNSEMYGELLDFDRTDKEQIAAIIHTVFDDAMDRELSIKDAMIQKINGGYTPGFEEPKEFYGNIAVSREELEKLNAYLQAEPNEYPDIISRDGVLFDREVKFPDGKRMAVRVIPPDDEESTAYTEAILLNEKGGCIRCTEPQEELSGEWEILCVGTKYVTSVGVVRDRTISIPLKDKVTKDDLNKAIKMFINQLKDSGFSTKDIKKEMANCSSSGLSR